MKIESSQVALFANNVHYKESKEQSSFSFVQQSHTGGGFTSYIEDSLKEKISMEKEVFVKTSQEIEKFIASKEIKREESFKAVDSYSKNGKTTRALRSENLTYKYENQKLDFHTKGVVKTSDNKEIEFNLNLSFSKEFESYHFQESIFTDPLIINFDSPSAAICTKDFSFDIDCDGREDQISRLKKGSGFLAFDKNGDGQINDGRELFGAITGDGFNELNFYDSDENGWIDENDEIFNRLQIFSVNEKGERSLTGLIESGVGAIYLGSEKTDYTVSTLAHGDLANVKRSGFFLKESGDIGTIQQVDLTKKQDRFENLTAPFLQGFSLGEIRLENLNIESFPVGENSEPISLVEFFLNRFLLMTDEEKEKEKERLLLNNQEYSKEKKNNQITL